MSIAPHRTLRGIARIATTVAALGLLGASAAPAGPLEEPVTLREWQPRIPRSVLAARPVATAVRLPDCGTPAVGEEAAGRVRATLARWADEHVPGPPGGTIRVAFHVITARGEGDVADERLHDQIRHLNRAFAGSGYRFELARVDRTEEPAWFTMTRGSATELEAKQALAVEPARHLNIYLCRPAQGVSGWATYPWEAPESQADHGVVLDHATVPGAGAVHQVGHYLGLLETGDAGETGIERMRSVVPIYRPSLFSARAPRGVAKPEIVPSAGAEPEDGRVLSYRGAYPNPFRAETMLRWTLPISQPVSLRIYSVTGQLVRTLVDAPLPPGDHSAMFRADDLPSGAYFAVLRAGSVQMSRTLLLVR